MRSRGLPFGKVLEFFPLRRFDVLRIGVLVIPQTSDVGFLVEQVAQPVQLVGVPSHALAEDSHVEDAPGIFTGGLSQVALSLLTEQDIGGCVQVLEGDGLLNEGGHGRFGGLPVSANFSFTRFLRL